MMLLLCTQLGLSLFPLYLIERFMHFKYLVDVWCYGCFLKAFQVFNKSLTSVLDA